MRHVLQPPKSGTCGQCCVAMLSGKSLSTVVKLFGHDRREGTYASEITAALKKLKIKSRQTMVGYRKDQPLPNTAILYVKVERNKHHWVVLHNNKIYDPGVGIFPASMVFNKFLNAFKIKSYLKIFDK